jgi:excinuclease ABC subunit C
MAETTSLAKVLRELADLYELPDVPKRIEVYDNSHIMGTNATGAMIVAGPEGFRPAPPSRLVSRFPLSSKYCQ